MPTELSAHEFRIVVLAFSSLLANMDELLDYYGGMPLYDPEVEGHALPFPQSPEIETLLNSAIKEYRARYGLDQDN